MNEKNKSPIIVIIDKKNWDIEIVKVYSNPCPNTDGITNANCDRAKEPSNPEKVFLGLHLLRDGPLKVLPNKYPPISLNQTTNIIHKK